MKVLLLKSVPKVGKYDEVVEVAEGYANHALFPKRLAVAATPLALAARDRRHQNTQAEKKIRHTLLNKAIHELESDQLVISVKANEQESLFSKITTTEIADELMNQKRIAIDPVLLTITDGGIKKLGTYVVGISDQGYSATFTIKLIAA